MTSTAGIGAEVRTIVRHEAPVRRRPPDRKASIVAAAIELFAERGAAAVRIDDIGDRVGISGPALYRHFRSKDALLAAVLLDVVATFDLAAAAADDLRSVVAATMRTALDRPGALEAYRRERSALRPDAMPELERAERRLYAHWRAVVRSSAPGLSSAVLDARSSAALACISAVVRRAPTAPRPIVDDVMTEALVSFLSAAPAVCSGPSGVPAPTATGAGPPRDRRRRWSPPTSRPEVILESALVLFHERGFHGVGVDDIGAAAGISGPTVYGYYDSKLEILAEAFDRAGARVTAGVHDALAGADSAGAALQALLVSYTDVARDNVDLIVVTSREGRSIADADRRRRSRQRRQVRDAWVGVLRELRPELSEGAARTLVAGVFPLVLELVCRKVPTDRVAGWAEAFLGVARAG